MTSSEASLRTKYKITFVPINPTTPHYKKMETPNPITNESVSKDSKFHNSMTSSQNSSASQVFRHFLTDRVRRTRYTCDFFGLGRISSPHCTANNNILPDILFNTYHNPYCPIPHSILYFSLFPHH